MSDFYEVDFLPVAPRGRIDVGSISQRVTRVGTTRANAKIEKNA